jgi:hypothetical protein
LFFGDGLKVRKITEFHSESVITSTYYSTKKAIFPESARWVLVLVHPFKEEADYIFNEVTMIVSAQQIERFESTMKTYVARDSEESTG